MKKKGQFFLIAAVIISGIVISFGTLYTESRIERGEAEKTYELTEEIYTEMRQVYDAGVLQDETNIEDKMEALAKYYAQQNPDSNFQVVYGDSNSLMSLEYDQESKEANSNPLQLQPPSGYGLAGSNQEEIILSVPTGEDGKTITRSFKLGQGKNFYILMRKKINNEEVVISRGGASS